jgi:HSP20 family protein
MSNITPTPLFPTERFNSLLEDLFDLPMHPAMWVPAVDIRESDSEYKFLIEAPGMNKEDLDIEVVGDMLTIKGKREDFTEEKNEQFIRRERKFGRFVRSFKLDAPVKPEDVKADYIQGVLTVTVPKVALKTPQRIPVN